MNKCKLIPNIRVNYGLFDLFCSLFISSRENKNSKEVERCLGNLLNTNEVLLTSSGRSAIYHILSYLPQSRVIVPAYTCDVVVEAAKLAGKEIVYAHVDRGTLNIKEIPELDSNTVFIATHQYGFPCIIKEICTSCKYKGAIVIEDCAGALGTLIDGQMAGTFGDFAVFSFNASKLINAPSNGGFLIARNESDLCALKKKIVFKPCSFKYKAKSICKSLAFCLDKNGYIHYWLSKLTKHDASKAHLSADTYYSNPQILGEYSYGFYDWQAFVVLKQLKQYQSLLQKRADLITIYKTRLHRKFQTESLDRQNSCIRYPIFLDNREEERRRLRVKGIELGYGFEHFVCPDDFKEEITMAQDIAYLPFSGNYTEKEVDYIVKTLNECK